MKIEIGQKAPIFTLVNSEKNKVSLEDFKGKNIVLLFFPASFSGACTKELCHTQDELAVYNDLNAVVLGISVDMPFTQAKFKELNNFNFTLLSDFNKEVSAAYDVLYGEWILGLKGVSKRSVIVIDKEGIISYIQVLENAGDFPDFDAVKAALTKLK